MVLGHDDHGCRRTRRKAVAAVAELVGALMLARAVDDPALSNEILDAAKQELLAVANR
jgi:TetR/AcrR family transcriptional regulator, transcriptional repressor for nem operon